MKQVEKENKEATKHKEKVMIDENITAENT